MIDADIIFINAGDIFSIGINDTNVSSNIFFLTRDIAEMRKIIITYRHPIN